MESIPFFAFYFPNAFSISLSKAACITSAASSLLLSKPSSMCRSCRLSDILQDAAQSTTVVTLWYLPFTAAQPLAQSVQSASMLDGLGLHRRVPSSQ